MMFEKLNNKTGKDVTLFYNNSDKTLLADNFEIFFEAC